MQIAVLGIKKLPADAGADRVVERLLEHRSGAATYHVYVIRSAGAPLCSDGVRYIHIPALQGKHTRAFSYFLLCTLHVLLTRRRFDVIHIHNSDFGIFGYLLSLFTRSPIIGTFHGNPYQRAKWSGFARTYLRWSERFFLKACRVTTTVAESKRAEVGPRDAERMQYIPNGIDPPVVDDESTDRFLEHVQLSGVPYAVFACGRLDSTKGLHHVLDVYERRSGLPMLLVIGDFRHDAGYSARILERTSRLSNVKVHDALLARGILLGVLSRAEVFIFPSEVEAMSMMLLEAISTAVPVVCSDIPENRAVVGDRHPFLFRSGDAAELEKVLLNVLATGTDRRSAVELRDRSFEAFHWGSIVKRYEQLYSELIHPKAKKNL